MFQNVDAIIRERKDEILSSILQYLADEDLDGAVIYTDEFRSVGGPTLVEYFAGYTARAARNLIFVSGTGDVVIAIDDPTDVNRVSRQSWVRDVRGAEDLRSLIAGVMTELRIDEEAAVHGLDQTTRLVYNALAERVEVRSADLSSFAHGNTEREVEIFRSLAAVADAGFETFHHHVRPGIKEYQLAALVEARMREEGAGENFNLLFSGRNGHGMRAPSDRLIDSGDLVEYELSPMYRGYSIQLCRSITLGPPSDLLKKKFDLLECALANAFAAMEVGIEAAVIAKTMNEVFKEAGYGEYCKPPYMRTRGHAFGIEPVGHTINEKTAERLEKGMALVIHPNQYIPETGYLVLGDPVLMTETGPEKLTHTESKLYTKVVQ